MRPEQLPRQETFDDVRRRLNNTIKEADEVHTQLEHLIARLRAHNMTGDLEKYESDRANLESAIREVHTFLGVVESDSAHYSFNADKAQKLVVMLNTGMKKVRTNILGNSPDTDGVINIQERRPR